MRYVVLAAGDSSRMGFDKTVSRSGGPAPLECVARALRERETVVVVPSRLRDRAAEMMPHATIVINDQSWRGMMHSLRAGLDSVAPGEPFGVLLGDMPAMTETTIARTEALVSDVVDVAFPVDPNGAPGHPVIFSSRARPIVDALPDGDTLRLARDHPALARATWTCADRSAFLDLDRPEDWNAFRS